MMSEGALPLPLPLPLPLLLPTGAGGGMPRFFEVVEALVAKAEAVSATVS